MPLFQDDPVVSQNNDQTDQARPAVHGLSRAVGVWGQSKTWHGVYGRSESTTGGQGVNGEGHVGVAGVGHTWIGVYGETRGTANGPSGVLGEGGAGGVGVKGHASGVGLAGVAGYSLTGKGPGIFGQGNPAGHFNGNVIVTGTLDVGVDIRLVNADCAEEFDVEFGPIEPGVVVVLSDGGRLLASSVAYDKRVAGVVSGAGGYRPGLTLDAQHATAERVPVALMGKVYCRVDAESAPIEIGDMLTTATTPGHAMKARDATRAFGAVIGKALGSLTTGRGLIPILVTLQ
jgi:hypothetical protein